ncbi:MAG TPA: ABC transporter [Clostridiales bacterium]|nr:ABC transporter [Clostridiales bacterium]
MIQLRNLTKTYISNKTKITPVQDVNLTIKDGEVFGIIGLSGAGKSTLVRCMNLTEKPTSGSVFIDGENLVTANEKQLRLLRKKISMIFQQYNLLQQRTVLKNVELAGEIHNDKGRREKAIRLLKLVGLESKLNAYPAELSGGQQQRVAIARALMTNPSVLLCDEATSALDPETTKAILELIKKLNKELNLTVVIISHQMSVIESICERVAIMDNSKIVEQGSITDIFLFPKENVTKKLIYSGKISLNLKGKKLIKITFNGGIDQPIIAKAAQDCNVLLSILHAETKILNGTTYGQVLLDLPNYLSDISKLKEYLNKEKIIFEEVDGNDFC